MATKKVGTLIKEARTNADLTQEQLARRISGLSAEDISLAERGKKALTQDQLKQIAKITGVTQTSLINAAKGNTAKNNSSKQTSSASKSSYMVTAEEKKLIQLYRKADSTSRRHLRCMFPLRTGILGNVLADAQISAPFGYYTQ